MQGTFKNLQCIWFNDVSIANILALSEVHKVCCITLDTDVDLPCVCTESKDGTIMKFTEHHLGLYVFDPANNKSTNQPVSTYSLLSSVANKKACLLGKRRNWLMGQGQCTAR
jgi:hypothetical protein